MRRFLAVVLFVACAFGQQVQQPPSNAAGSSGSFTNLNVSGTATIGTTLLDPTNGIKGPIVACVGAPGNTTGPYGSLCEVRATGALWGCTNAVGCTVSGDWAAAGGGGGGSSLFTSYQFGSQTALTGSGLYLQTTYPSIFSLTQTGSGTSGSPYIDALSLASQTQNTFFAAPNGSSGAPTFRAIVAADVPTLNQSTTGTAANVTGVVAEANGGTGSNVTTGAAGHYLRSNGTHYVDSSIQAGDVPTLNQNTTGTAGNVTGIVAEANGGTGANNTPGAAGHVLRSNGTHYVDSAIQGTDLPGQVYASNVATIAAGNTRYFAAAGAQSSESLAWWQVNQARTLSNLTCWTGASTGGNDAAHTATITLRINSVDTAATVNLTSSSSAGNVAGTFSATDNTHTVSAAAGDLLTFKAVTGASVASTTYGCSITLQ